MRFLHSLVGRSPPRPCNVDFTCSEDISIIHLSLFFGKTECLDLFDIDVGVEGNVFEMLIVYAAGNLSFSAISVIDAYLIKVYSCVINMEWAICIVWNACV